VLLGAGPLVGVVHAGKKTAEAKGAPDLKLPKAFNRKNTEKHLREHQRYPATKAQLLAECDNLADFPDVDRRWFAEHLPDRSYSSPDAVLEAVGLKTAAKN